MYLFSKEKQINKIIEVLAEPNLGEVHEPQLKLSPGSFFLHEKC